MKIVNIPDELTARYAEKLIGNIDKAKKADPLLKLIEKLEKTIGSLKWSALMTDAYKRGGKHDVDFVKSYDEQMETVKKSVTMLDMVTDHSRIVVKTIKADKDAAKTLKKEIVYLDGLPKVSYSVHKAFTEGEKEDRKLFAEFLKSHQGKGDNPFRELHVDDVFRDKKLLTALHKYAKKELSAENIEFYWEATKAKSAGAVQALYDKYVDLNAPNMLNITDKSRNALLAGINADNWDAAMKSIKTQVKENINDTLKRMRTLDDGELKKYL
ncbi:regulator of G-protein signaling domain-containing protein [Azospirillum canadense]|uniref:regulator of G-protein signaling domain-containing protein n=1 Tax=Azospirillum canadense TaxID=403962 RepID=UPI0022261B7C|nr:regulator of G-protein signaling domain-containing protein [Azospirillum canadense]MCW2240010.1 hypothetical protein [Azospirillum canadense]